MTVKVYKSTPPHNLSVHHEHHHFMILHPNLHTMDSSSSIQIEENKQCPETRETSFLTILKEAFIIPFKNIHFTSFILITSLPLLFLTIFFEKILEKSLQESLQLVRPYVSPREYWYLPFYHVYAGLENLSKVFSENILLISFIYLIPLPILDFTVAYATIFLTSKVYKNDSRWSFTFSSKNRLKSVKGFLVTAIMVQILSTTLLIGFILPSIALYTCNLFSLDVFALVFCLAALYIGIPKYLEVNALWSLSLVVSAVGNIHGIDAFVVAPRYSKGKEKVGCYLMAVFFVWGFVLRITCLFFEDGMVGIVGRTSLLWLGSLVKWAVCVVYFYQCTGSEFEKRMTGDEEGGSCGGANEKGLPPPS